MAFNEEMILQLYQDQAQKYGDKGESTIVDIRTRQLEMQAIFQYINESQRILEVGCGNGFVAEAIVKEYAVDLHAIDFSPDMITIAQQRPTDNILGRVRFEHCNILQFSEWDQYDLIFTERCLQNIMDWELQKAALSNIARALKPNGKFVMLESFTDSFANLNAARRELALSEIPVPYHNLPFDPELVKEHLATELSFEHENRCLSGYYFGTRLLYPAMLPAGQEPVNSSIIKDYFVSFPNGGDFSPMKILCFSKN